VFKFERVITFYHCPVITLRWEEEKTLRELPAFGKEPQAVLIYLSRPNTVLALERAAIDIITVRSHAHSFGRRRKLPEPYNLMA